MDYKQKRKPFFEQQHIHVVKSPKEVFIVPMGDLKKTQAKCYCKFSQAAYRNVCCASSVLACSESTPWVDALPYNLEHKGFWF